MVVVMSGRIHRMRNHRRCTERRDRAPYRQPHAQDLKLNYRVPQRIFAATLNIGVAVRSESFQ